MTVVTYEIDSNYNIQRFNAQQQPLLGVTTSFGAGIGDINADQSINSTDINQLATLVQNNTTQFNAAADVNGDGVIDLADTFLMGPVLADANVDAATNTAFTNFIHSATVTGGTYTVNGSQSVFEVTAGTTSVTAGSSLLATNVRGNTLTLAAGASVTIRPNASNAAGVSKTALTLSGATDAWTSKLDLQDNDIIVTNGDLAALTNEIKSGLNLAHNGFWNGSTGITSAAAANDATHLTALGILLNRDHTGQPIYGSGTIHGPFDGLDAGVNDVLIRYTYFGDTDLNGTVDGGDYTKIDDGFNLRLAGWSNGDFNYDGVIDGADYALIDNAFLNQAAHGGPLGPATSAAVAANVAEPLEVPFLIGALVALTWRSRCHRV
jgi:hypothetical protein